MLFVDSRNRWHALLSLLLIACLFTACNTSPSPTNKPIVSPVVVETPVSSLDLVPTKAGTISPTAQETLLEQVLLKTASAQPTNMPTASLTPSISVISDRECPPLHINSMLPLQSGSILFGQFKEKAGIWALSATMTEIQPIYHGRTIATQLSPDGRRLVFYEHQTEPAPIVVYDLVTAQTVELLRQDGLGGGLQWSEDGKVRILQQRESAEGSYAKGYMLFDPSTQTTTVVTQTISLPGYIPPQKTLGALFKPFAAFDPTGLLVLYDAKMGSTLILRDWHTNRTLWQFDFTERYPYVWPDWTEDGSQVAFATVRHIDGEERGRIYSLSRDGQNLQLLADFEAIDLKDTTHLKQTWPKVRHLLWSPDAKYLYFAWWNSGAKGPGFVLDVTTGQLLSICLEESETFLYAHSWIPKTHQLLYYVEDADESKEIRLLDIESWQSYKIEASSGTAIYGWTPLEEFP